MRIRVQIQTSEETALYKGPWDAAKSITRYYGFKALYRGAMTTFWREAVGGALYFGTYESFLNI